MVGGQAVQQARAPDSALRVSADGRSRFVWFLSQHWFQVDVRAARVTRTLAEEENSENDHKIIRDSAELVFRGSDNGVR